MTLLLSSLHSSPVDRTEGEFALRAAQDHLKREENAEAIMVLRGPLGALAEKKRVYDDATAGLEAGGRRLDEAEGYGIDAGPLKEELGAATRAYSGGAYDESARLSKSTVELAENLISERAAQAMGDLRDQLEDSERSGTVLDDLHERVGALSGAFSSKSFSGLFKETVAIRAEIGRRKARHAEAVSALGRIQAAIEEIKAMGANLSPTEDLLGLARFASERGAYDDVLDYVRRAEVELTVAAEAGLREQQGRLSRRIEEMAREGV